MDPVSQVFGLLLVEDLPLILPRILQAKQNVPPFCPIHLQRSRRLVVQFSLIVWKVNFHPTASLGEPVNLDGRGSGLRWFGAGAPQLLRQSNLAGVRPAIERP
jgi:hypothetical protein